MFNYLDKAEKDFNATLHDEDHYFACRAHIAKQLFVPFSRSSFGSDDILLNAFKTDLILLCWNFISLIEFFKGPLLNLILSQLISPFCIAFGALDLCYNLTMLALSLVTRSLTTLYYMATYNLSPKDNKADNNQAFLEEAPIAKRQEILYDIHSNLTL